MIFLRSLLILILAAVIGGCATPKHNEPIVVDLSKDKTTLSVSDLNEIKEEAIRIQKEPIIFIQIYSQSKVNVATGGFYGGRSYDIFKINGHWRFSEDGKAYFWNQ